MSVGIRQSNCAQTDTTDVLREVPTPLDYANNLPVWPVNKWTWNSFCSLRIPTAQRYLKETRTTLLLTTPAQGRSSFDLLYMKSKLNLKSTISPARISFLLEQTSIKSVQNISVIYNQPLTIRCFCPKRSEAGGKTKTKRPGDWIPC